MIHFFFYHWFLYVPCFYMFLYAPQTYVNVSIVYSRSPTYWAPIRASNGKSSGKKSCGLRGRVLVEKSQSIHIPSLLFHLPHPYRWLDDELQPSSSQLQRTSSLGSVPLQCASSMQPEVDRPKL